MFKGIRDLAERCKPPKATAALTMEDLLSMGCTFTALPDIKSISKEVLCGPRFLSETLGPCMKAVPDNVRPLSA